MTLPPLAGTRALVVEDESMVLLLLEDQLLEYGCEVETASRLKDGLALARSSSINFAVLDVNLAGEHSFPIADVLRERGIPFLFATGYGRQGLTADYQDTPTLQKPYPLDALGAMVAKILGSEGPSASI